jgi:hypothetical protein
MHSETLKLLYQFKDNLVTLTESKGEVLINSTNSIDLENELETKVVGYINETIEEIDTIIGDIEDGVYNETSDDEYVDY